MSGLEKYRQAAEKGVEFLARSLDEEGLYKNDPQAHGDLGAIYKMPMQLLMSGRTLLCARMLDTMQRRFLQPNGDLLSYPDKTGLASKTDDWHLAYNWPYINGWIGMAAHRSFKFDLAQACLKYMLTFQHPKQKGFLWAEPYDASKDARSLEQTVCAFMTSHLGLTCLVYGDVERARAAGEYIVELMSRQPDLKMEILYKTRGDSGQIVQDFPEDKASFFTVRRDQPKQRYYKLGYPVMFLQKLYLATGEKKFLDTAKMFLEFALTCQPDIFSYPLSHKVAYGAALVYSVTKEEKYREVALRVADVLVSVQTDSGQFLKDWELLPSLDQTAENSGWLREIYVELSR